jgi:hypothetical protein
MELQNNVRAEALHAAEKRELEDLEDLIYNVPTDVSGKWINKDELIPFARAVLALVLAKIERKERKANDPAL